MSLTFGWGPFGPNPAGTFNFQRDGPERVLYFERSPRQVRVVFNHETVAESDRARLLHETAHMPVYYFPEEDVRTDLLEPTDHRTECPIKGEARHWTVRVGERATENAAWAYPEPIAGAPPLAGHRAFYWKKMDAWFEEDEQIYVHPRDPYHRVDCLHSSRRVRVAVGGETVAESDEPVALFETGLRTRFYVAREDVRMDKMERTDTRTRCPYKGATTAYWHVRAGGEYIENAAWSYGQPLAAVAPIAGRIAFYDEKVDLFVDGERYRPPFSLRQKDRREMTQT